VLALLLALVTATRPTSAAEGRPYTNPLKSAKGACDSQRTHVLESAGSDPMGPSAVGVAEQQLPAVAPRPHDLT
jgi:hypothetical protein